MRKIVVFPSDSMDSYIKLGQTYKYFEEYFNPGGYFDKVYALSPWGTREYERIGNVEYIKSKPLDFKRIIKEIRPDVVRAYGGYWCADWAVLSKVPGIPVIVSVHDTNPELIYNSVKYADFVICMAECVKDVVLDKVELQMNRVGVLPNRIDVDLFRYNNDEYEKQKLNERFGSGKHVLHVGRKSEQKNLDTLIKALKYLDRDVSIIFVGRGDEEPYRELAKQIGVADRCFFVEAVKNIELPLWYSWCDCFCTPSRWEGFGFVFIEAASCMCPIVTSNIAPMNEYLSSGNNSILVDEYNNPREIAHAINVVLAGGEKIENMKIRARDVGLQFSKVVIDKKEINIYERIIKGKAQVEKVPITVRAQLVHKYMKYK